MSKKLKKFLNDAEKTESKIAELEEYLRNVRAAQKKEEDNEIVRAIRSTKLGGRDLLALLENIQAGNVTFQTTVNNENKTSEEGESCATYGGSRSLTHFSGSSIFRIGQSVFRKVFLKKDKKFFEIPCEMAFLQFYK